jgi:hypothetical protein
MGLSGAGLRCARAGYSMSFGREGTHGIRSHSAPPISRRWGMCLPYSSTSAGVGLNQDDATFLECTPDGCSG